MCYGTKILKTYQEKVLYNLIIPGLLIGRSSN
jgi:hypothetical protein